MRNFINKSEKMLMTLSLIKQIDSSHIKNEAWIKHIDKFFYLLEK